MFVTLKKLERSPVALYWLLQILHWRTWNIPRYEWFWNTNRILEIFENTACHACNTQYVWDVPSSFSLPNGWGSQTYYNLWNSNEGDRKKIVPTIDCLAEDHWAEPCNERIFLLSINTKYHPPVNVTVDSDGVATGKSTVHRKVRHEVALHVAPKWVDILFPLISAVPFGEVLGLLSWSPRIK